MQPAGADSNMFSNCFNSQTGTLCQSIAPRQLSLEEHCLMIWGSSQAASAQSLSLAAMAATAMQQQVLCSHLVDSPR